MGGLGYELHLEDRLNWNWKGLYVYFLVFYIDHQVLFCICCYNSIFPYISILIQHFSVPRMGDIMVRDKRVALIVTDNDLGWSFPDDSETPVLVWSWVELLSNCDWWSPEVPKRQCRALSGEPRRRGEGKSGCSCLIPAHAFHFYCFILDSR